MKRIKSTDHLSVIISFINESLSKRCATYQGVQQKKKGDKLEKSLIRPTYEMNKNIVTDSNE